MPPAATTADIEALDAQARRLMAAFTRRGLRAHRAGRDPAGGPVPRRRRREPARAHLRVHRSRRRRIVPAPRPHGADLPAAPGAARATADTRARYCYAGSAFRYQPAGAGRAHPREFHQAGIESFAAPDRERDDAAVLALIVTALREAGPRRPAAAHRRPRPVRGADQRASHAGALALAAQAPVLAARGVPRRAGAPFLRQGRRGGRGWRSRRPHRPARSGRSRRRRGARRGAPRQGRASS